MYANLAFKHERRLLVERVQYADGHGLGGNVAIDLISTFPSSS
jgi:hypothetical protein